MKNLELRSSLIKSGILLGLCIFFIYAFAADGSGGVGGTISSLFSGATFLVGLAIALVVSILVIFAVYFGILYLYNPDVSKKTYGELKETVSNVSSQLPVSAQCCSSTGGDTSANLSVTEDDIKPLHATQNKLAAQLSSLNGNVESLQKDLNSLSASLTSNSDVINELGEKAAKIEEELANKASSDAIEDASKKLGADISGLKSSIQPLTDKLAGLEETMAGLDGDSDEGGDDVMQAKIDEAVGNLQKDLNDVKKSIAKLSPAAPAATDEEESAHRILTYFTKKADEKKFVASVQEAVTKDMTYAQIGEFLNESLSKEAAEVIADHPSLTKDYIRDCRQKD